MGVKTSSNAAGFRITPVWIFRLALLLLIDVAAIWFVGRLWEFGHYPLSAAIITLVLIVNIVLIGPKMYPIRWMLIGLVFMGLFTIYPILFTVWVSTTNYGDGHLITKQQAIDQILDQKYLPVTGKAFGWTAYKSEAGEYVLWLIDADGRGFLAQVGRPLSQPKTGENGVGEFDNNGIPKTIEGYNRLNAIQTAADKEIPNIQFGDPAKPVQIRSPKEAAELTTLYVYDEAQDAMTNQETGDVYKNVNGTFTFQSKEIIPGFIEQVGITNFQNFFTSPALRGPLVRILIWNFAFAGLSVLMTFSLGLAIAILFNEKGFPAKRLIRSLLLIPYTIPSLITILIWRGMMNPEVGVINTTLRSLFGISPPWFTDEWLAKFAILLVNLWLGYPYFMLITSGALQSIPNDIYEASRVDGASAWQQFWRITLPLLLVAVGPLMLASFTYNFNNFNLIYLFIGGGPPIPGSNTPAGHTDILISYVYNLAFQGGRGIQYGFAAAITIIIFFIVGAITLFQFRYTRMWEEVSENV
jgi:ABC-type sugar transport system permease subunit